MYEPASQNMGNIGSQHYSNTNRNLNNNSHMQSVGRFKPNSKEALSKIFGSNLSGI